jgi:hypothetical protein
MKEGRRQIMSRDGAMEQEIPDDIFSPEQTKSLQKNKMFLRQFALFSAVYDTILELSVALPKTPAYIMMRVGVSFYHFQ